MLPSGPDVLSATLSAGPWHPLAQA